MDCPLQFLFCGFERGANLDSYAFEWGARGAKGAANYVPGT